MEPEDVTLRAFREADVPTLALLRNDAGAQRALMWRPAPHDDAAVRAWLRRRTDDTKGVFFVIADASDAVIGFVQLVDIDRVAGHAKLGICLSPTAHSQGAGREALGRVEAFAHDVLGLRKLTLEVLAENHQAIGLYASSGYRQVGVLASHFAFGHELLDVLIMERHLGSTP